MTLSKISLRPMRCPQILAIRLSSAAHGALPPPAAKQLPAPSELGFFTYTRHWSRNKKYDLSRAPQKGDTPKRFLLRRLDHAYEIYPLIFLTTFSFATAFLVIYWSFDKVEVWVDRSKDEAPWDWSRIHDTYWKQHTLAFDPDGRTHRRLETMEQLQDEMLDAAKMRGTRK